MKAADDGSAGFGYCPRCGELVIMANVDGSRDVRIRRISVPTKDAEVLSRYGEVIYRVWQYSILKHFIITSWRRCEGRPGPDEGRLYVLHKCYDRP